jgi:AcrR family transcriptional regulator
MPKKSPSNRPPKQDRSLRTQERLLEAMEYLLERREPAEITVDEIADRAHVSVGAFYKRFGSKQDLLPLLLARLQTASRGQLLEALDESKWRGRRLEERIDALIDMIADVHTRRQKVIRACVTGRFTATLQMSSQDLEDARALMEIMRNWLLACRAEIRHPQPEMAVRLGLYMCLQSLQTALLFENLPPDITRDTIVGETKRMLARYLGANRTGHQDTE